MVLAEGKLFIVLNFSVKTLDKFARILYPKHQELT